MLRALLLVVFVSSCREVFSAGLIESSVPVADQQKIINEHNKLRLQIARGQVLKQPPGADLYVTRWDNDLARTAQQLANTCIFAHKTVTDRRFPAVGQNLYMSTSTQVTRGANWVAGINAWFDEYKTYRFGSSTYNHYTQVVWAKTYLIGCGYAHCNTPPYYMKLYVCHYGPAGNYVGQTPYKSGRGCTNLCAAPK